MLPRIGIALGSGSARGWAHIGIVEALVDAGIRPDIVCGTSIGALVGAAQVAGRLVALKDFAERLSWREIVGLMDVRLSGGGIVNGAQILELLRRLGIAEPIESYANPFAAVATDLGTGREIWLREGPIHQAVRASISLPGIFSPVRIGDSWLADGGLVNPVPVSACRALGADIVIAVNLNDDITRRFEDGMITHTNAEALGTSPELLQRLVEWVPPGLREQASAIASRLLQAGPATPGYFDVLTGSIHVMQDLITRARLAGEPPHVLLVPKLRQIGLLEYNRAAEAIAEGRACVEQAMPALRRYIAEGRTPSPAGAPS